VRQLIAFAQDLFNTAPLDDSAQAEARAQFNQCLLLAVLLHIWLVAVLGSSPGGNAAPGEGAYGSLTVRLQAPVAQPGLEASVQPADSGPTGQARQQRHGGTVRPIDEPLQAQPGAQTSGTWRALDSQNDPNLAEPLPTAPEVTPLPAAPTETLPEIQRPSMSDTAQRAAVAPAAPLGKLAPSRSPELAPLPAPAFDALHPAATMNDSAQRAAPVEAKPLGRLAPGSTPDLKPLPAASLDSLRPAAEMSETSAVPTPAREAPAAPAKLPSTRLPDFANLPPVDAPGPAATAPKAAAGEAPNGPTASPSPAPGGTPNAGSQQGHDVATPPSATPGPKPLNLNLPLARGPLASSRGSTGMLPVVPRPPEVKPEVDKAVEKTLRDDCRKAYAGAGLLAVVPLAVDTARDKGCKW
jgi:Meckel syndrome type 1 protein